MTTLITAPSAETPGRLAWLRQPVIRSVGIYLGVRCFGVALLAVLASVHGRSLVSVLRSWDGDWYLAIAEYGYARVPDSMVDATGQHTPDTALAFFPAYPALMHVVAAGTGIGLIGAGLLISLVAGIAAAGALHRIGAHLDPRGRIGPLLVALWAGAPMAITLSMTYTEALFTAFAAWALVAVLERQWLFAGSCCLVSGLIRSTAAVLIVVVGVAAIRELLRRRGSWPALACLLLCPLGLVGYWAYVAAVTRDLSGWFDIELGWYTKFDGGRQTIEFVGKVLASDAPVMETGTVLIVFATAVLAVLAVVPFRRRLPWPVAAYSIGMVVFVLGTAGITYAKARFLVPAITLPVPLAAWLATLRRPVMISVTAGIVLLGCWFSAYALTGWQYAI